MNLHSQEAKSCYQGISVPRPQHISHGRLTRQFVIVKPNMMWELRCASCCGASRPTSLRACRINPDIWAMVPNDPYGERLFMEAAQSNGNLDDVIAAIVSHRSSYVNESDFKLMSKNGINAVRAGFGGCPRALLIVYGGSMPRLKAVVLR